MLRSIPQTLGVLLAAACTIAFALPASAFEAHPPAAATAVALVDASSPLAFADVAYTHYDCVGSGLPGTAPLHATHTTTVGGFAFNGVPVSVNILSLAISGSGICPTTVGGPVLPEDFTGRYTVTLVCGAGATNAGAVFLSWTIHFLAGFPTSQSSVGTPCFGPAGGPLSLAITVDMGQTTVPIVNLLVGPTGGILLSVSQ